MPIASRLNTAGISGYADSAYDVDIFLFELDRLAGLVGHGTVPIDDDTLAAFVTAHGNQNRERERWAAAYQDEGWMFCRENCTHYLPDCFTKRTKQACKEAGVPAITPHDFRHLTATLLLEASVPTKVVSDLLGHSSTAITADIYQTERESAARVAVGHISERI